MVRVNGKIRAREVRVIGDDGHQLGVLGLPEAIRLAQSQGVDLVEIAPNATPPVCRLVDYGKFRYEQSKKDKVARKHQHANKLKEIQLSASIDPHDYSIKLGHATDFLCEEMKVKVALRFRGREMMHTEYGFQVVQRFINDLAVYGHPDAPPKLIGKGINLILSPLPRNKRAKNPRQTETGASAGGPPQPLGGHKPFALPDESPQSPAQPSSGLPPKPASSAFSNNPFANLDSYVKQDEEPEAAAGS
jgi:translation initiation factor IF-3